MDLVDIDKVLDDLELNEGDGGKAQLECASHQERFEVGKAENAGDAHEAVTPKRFVGVSQVMSSLSDYQKDVEKLEADIKRFETTASSPEAADDTENSQSDGECLTSSSSITTSSASSFSSGPSPRGMSADSSSLNSEDSGNPAGGEDKEEAAPVGLSSISSCFYNEQTLSSLPGFTQDIMQTDGLSSSALFSQTERDLDLGGIVNPAFESTAVDTVADVKNVPVAFGSTMDEISDTELDSMLQEIDSELNNLPLPEVVEEEAEADTDPQTEAELVVEKAPSPKAEDNQQNADSFSQASTVEFAELRLQNDFESVASADLSGSTNSGAKNEPQPQRPNSLDLTSNLNLNANAGQTPPGARLADPASLDEAAGGPPETWNGNGNGSGANNNNSQLGKVPPFWIPDSEASACMQCKQKFSLLKRRHHCRACGQVLCSMCCSQKAKLEFLGDAEQRVCVQCHLLLAELQEAPHRSAPNSPVIQPVNLGRPPNPNNPMEYCSMIPPHQQVSSEQAQTPISVMVPVGVLKREGAPKTARKEKTVIFSDGIRPGCDLTRLDKEWDDVRPAVGTSSASTAAGSANAAPVASGSQANGTEKVVTDSATVEEPVVPKQFRSKRKCPPKDENDSFISKERKGLPPIYVSSSGSTADFDFEYKEVQNDEQLVERLHRETLKFAVQRNFYVYVKIVKLKCCVNKTIINFTTFGMHHVGQDELIILLEVDDSGEIPKDVFEHLNEIYNDADKGQPISELGFSTPKTSNFLGRREHGGFLYIRPTFQCLQEIHLPESPYLIGLLIHRWEVPWAKIFPLRLMLRLGAQYRYYPSPQVSVRGRDSVYAEIAQTIINFLADFRNYSYTLATIKGMYIHMEDRKTSVLIPRNRYDQIIKALNNSSDHILALGGNFSKKADGHLVCIQNLKTDCADTHAYSTQAINIQGQPRKVTGASFIVLNGALKTASGLSGKCSIVEDGLMVQILPTKMTQIRNALKNMKDIEIVCGPVDADESMTEIVSLKWTGNDAEFNVGVTSPIDARKMDGVPSIRVHSGLNYSNANHIIRWTEVFILQSDEESAHGKDPIDMSKLSEQIARSTSIALVSFLDLLAAGGCVKLGLRATLSQDNVSYEAGSNSKLPPLYMKALDNELIPTLHKQATMLDIDTPIVLELIFHILDK